MTLRIVPLVTKREFAQVDPSSELAGYSYGTSHGRYATFWQNTSTEPGAKHNSQKPDCGRLSPILTSQEK